MVMFPRFFETAQAVLITFATTHAHASPDLAPILLACTGEYACCYQHSSTFWKTS